MAKAIPEHLITTLTTRIRGHNWLPGGNYIGKNTDKTNDAVEEYKPQGRFLTQDGVPDRDKLLQTLSPMQPELRIPAEPGKSGSSEVFRTDAGGKPTGPQDYAWNYGPYSNSKPTDARIPIGNDGHAVGEDGENRSEGGDQRLARKKTHYASGTVKTTMAGSR